MREKIKKYKKYIIPGTALIISFYASIVFAIGIVFGYLSTEIFCKKLVKTGKIDVLIFDIKGWELHLHHWVLGMMVIMGAHFFNIVEYLPITFFGFLGGLIFHDIYTDKKWKKNDKAWHQIIYKKEVIEENANQN